MKIIENILITIGALFLLILSIPWFYTKSYTTWLEERENAEQNDRSLIHPLWSLVEKCSTMEEKNKIEDKIRAINEYMYFKLHSGRTPDAEYDYESIARVSQFFKRNNIDIYSEDFDPEYVAKCVKEQEIC